MSPRVVGHDVAVAVESEQGVTIEFVVEAVIPASGIVIARLVEYPPANFKMTDAATLGTVAIEPTLTMPRALDESGAPRFDMFAFAVRNAADLVQFSEGDEVTLAGVVAVQEAD